MLTMDARPVYATLAAVGLGWFVYAILRALTVDMIDDLHEGIVQYEIPALESFSYILFLYTGALFTAFLVVNIVVMRSEPARVFITQVGCILFTSLTLFIIAWIGVVKTAPALSMHVNLVNAAFLAYALKNPETYMMMTVGIYTLIALSTNMTWGVS